MQRDPEEKRLLDPGILTTQWRGPQEEVNNSWASFITIICLQPGLQKVKMKKFYL